VPSLGAVTAGTTLRPKFQSVSCHDYAQLMRRRVMAETDVEAVLHTVNVVLAVTDHEE